MIQSPSRKKRTALPAVDLSTLTEPHSLVLIPCNARQVPSVRSKAYALAHAQGIPVSVQVANCGIAVWRIRQ